MSIFRNTCSDKLPVSQACAKCSTLKFNIHTLPTPEMHNHQSNSLGTLHLLSAWRTGLAVTYSACTFAVPPSSQCWTFPWAVFWPHQYTCWYETCVARSPFAGLPAGASVPPSSATIKQYKSVTTVSQIFIYGPVNSAVSNSRVHSIKLFDAKSITYCKVCGTNQNHKNPGWDNWSLDTSLTLGALPTCHKYLALHVKCKTVFRIFLEVFM